MNKWYIHNPEFVLENETLKILWDFEIQTDHLNSARRPDLDIVNKKKRTYWIVDFAVRADHQSKTERKWELKKTMEHKSDGDISC